MTKRAKLEIIRDILRIIKENDNFIKPTPLLRKSGLSSKNFKEYYLELTKRALLKEVSGKEDKTFVILTDKGFNFLERYNTIIEFIEEFEL